METKKEELKFLDPEEVLGQLAIDSGATAADFGCGSGYFSIALAKAVGSEGKVFALDVVPQALEAVAGKADLAGLSNISTRRVNLEKESGSGLEADSLDWVVLKDILFQNQDKKTILGEARRVLKADGKVLIVEWDGQFQGIGPAVELRIKKEELQKMAEKAGLALGKELQAGKFHYAFVFRKI